RASVTRWSTAITACRISSVSTPNASAIHCTVSGFALLPASAFWMVLRSTPTLSASPCCVNLCLCRHPRSFVGSHCTHNLPSGFLDMLHLRKHPRIVLASSWQHTSLTAPLFATTAHFTAPQAAQWPQRARSGLVAGSLRGGPGRADVPCG